MKATAVIADDIFWQILLYFVVHTTGNKHLGGLEEGGGSAAFRSDFSPWLLTAHRLFRFILFLNGWGLIKLSLLTATTAAKRERYFRKGEQM